MDRLGSAAIETTSGGWSGEDSSASSIQSTLWSVILRTHDPKDPQRIAALIQLCSQFSMALYAYVRGKGASPEDSRGAVQGYISHVRDGNLTSDSGHHWKRLRSFLLRGFEDYLDTHPLPTPVVDRGKERAPESLDFSGAESWFLSDPSREEEPERTFNRAWARAILEQAHAELKRELTASHGPPTAELIAAEVSSIERRPFNDQLALRLGLSATEILQILRASRRRLRELIKSTLRETVSASADVEVEFWDLFQSV